MDERGIDSLEMWGATLSLPDQLEGAVDRASGVLGLPDRGGIENVVVLGMGGSGIAGDVLAATAGPFLPVPVVVLKTYGCPAFVSDRSLVFAISFSGDTEETLDATGAAIESGAHVIAVTRGGELAARARAWDVPWISVDEAIPQPRAGIGAVSVPPMIVLEEMGLFPGARSWIGLAAEQLRRRVAEHEAGRSAAGDLARAIGRTMPLVYGGGGVGQVAAQRWKNQFNENAKVPAWAHAIPELCHNEVAGWGQHGDVTRQVLTLLELRHDHEHPQIGPRFELVRRFTDEVVADVLTVEASGEGALAQLLDLVLVGDLVSLHLAEQEGVDPGPVPVLAELKAALTG